MDTKVKRKDAIRSFGSTLHSLCSWVPGLGLVPLRSFAVPRALHYWKHHQQTNLVASICSHTPSMNLHAGDFPLCGYCLEENFRAVGERLKGCS